MSATTSPFAGSGVANTVAVDKASATPAATINGIAAVLKSSTAQ